MFSGRQILKNTLLLTAAALLLRFASMLFQAHLAGRIGAEGLGAVQLLLSVFAFATTLGLAGMRVAASCLCAQAHGRREPAQVQLAAAHCLGFVLVTSTLAAAGLYWAAPVLAGRVLHEPAAVGSLRLLAGLLPAGCAGLVLGGYLTAVGKVWQLTAIDAGERVLGLGLSLILLRFAPQTVSGACFALLGGELLSSCAADAALYALYRQSWRGVRQTDAPGMARRVGALAAPLALNDLLRAALRALEQFLIPWGLTRAGATRLGAMAAYGTVMGMVFPALMLPSAFLYALVDLLIPELAACRAQGRRERLASVTGQCLRAGLLFAGFTAGLLYALAEPLTAILYQSEQAGRLLRVFAPLALVLYLDALTDGMLKGLSEQVANVRYNTLTSALDAVLLVLLLPRWGRLYFRVRRDASSELHAEPAAAADRHRLSASTGRGIGRRGLHRSRRACGAAAAGAGKRSGGAAAPRGGLFRCVYSGCVSQRNGGALSAAEPAGAAVSAGTQRKNAGSSLTFLSKGPTIRIESEIRTGFSMISFRNDYSEGAHPKVLAALEKNNLVTTCGYSMDDFCAEARGIVRARFSCPQADVHFMVGGTIANTTVIAAALRPWEGVIAADTGHINVHETGAIEASGHKVCAIEAPGGKLTPALVRELLRRHCDGQDEHMVLPRMVYISDATELGTIYTKSELSALHDVCREYGLYLFLDGARLPAALVAEGNDLAPADFAKYCDVFYIGGTKNGLLFGEALVITNDSLKPHFRNMIKQRGGMFAKGFLFGTQFKAYFEDDLWLTMARHAVTQAQRIQKAAAEKGYSLYAVSPTNQVFLVLSHAQIERLKQNFAFELNGRVDEDHEAARFVCSWATKPEAVDALIAAL